MNAWPRKVVGDLQKSGVLFVEDGNHGQDRPRHEEFVPGGVAFIRAADLGSRRVDFDGASKINNVAYDRIRKGFGKPLDVLLSHKGTVGRVAMAPPDSPAFVCSPQTTYWRSLDHSRLDPKYLRYYLESPAFTRQTNARKGETDMAAYVSLTEQRRFEVVLPPIETQRGIGAALGSLDDKIASNVRLVDLALQLIRSKVVHELAGAEENVPVVRLARFVNGGAYTKDASGTGRMVIRIADLNSGPGPSTVYNDIDVPDEKTARPGDILMSWSGSLGIYRWFREEAIVNQHIFGSCAVSGGWVTGCWRVAQPSDALKHRPGWWVADREP
jgi:type I restriction enzyme S subunit